jgi:thiol-disulfide isomerase/thioredoxin
LAGRPEEAQAVKALIEVPPPQEKGAQVQYWWRRARLADLEGRETDALAYYQAALYARSEPPKPWRGKTDDNLGDEARALWKDLGGTDTAWAVWSKPPAGKAEELTEGRWEKPPKELSAFELYDLAGKTWRLKELAGKALLINVWATWCGPCLQELPHLQKLYDKLKDRSDIQILTFNVDEDLGLVAPYLKEKGYTFPALAAHNFVYGMLGGVGIPQNWIVDQKGTWQWIQYGFGGDANWEDEMIKRLESTKPAQ